MADQLYLSLWFPNFRLASLPSALASVLEQFAVVARDGKPDSEFGRVFAASAFPLDWTQSPIYQRIYVNDRRAAETPDTRGAEIGPAVSEATEQLHDDTAYEFEMRWQLWQPAEEGADDSEVRLDTLWQLQPAKARVSGFGPDFDAGSYEQNGHIRIDLGPGHPLDRGSEEDDPEASAEPLDATTAEYIRQNVEKLLAFTLLVEKHCGISSRLLWTEMVSRWQKS